MLLLLHKTEKEVGTFIMFQGLLLDFSDTAYTPIMRIGVAILGSKNCLLSKTKIAMPLTRVIVIRCNQ